MEGPLGHRPGGAHVHAGARPEAGRARGRRLARVATSSQLPPRGGYADRLSLALADDASRAPSRSSKRLHHGRGQRTFVRGA
jgi:hypothetical protein